MEPIPDTARQSKNLEKKPATIILLKERNNKMIPNDTLQYPWINASISPHHSFFLAGDDNQQRPTTGQWAKSGRI